MTFFQIRGNLERIKIQKENGIKYYMFLKLFSFSLPFCLPFAVGKAVGIERGS